MIKYIKMYPVIYIFPTLLILILLRKYRESKWGRCKNNIELNGKTAIVTGANSGIGLEIAKELAARNAKVILACRNFEKANEICQIIKSKLFGKADVIPMELNLASLSSIKNFSNAIRKCYKKIDLLINNAGVSYPKNRRLETEDGFEIHFGVNYLGHFYLTNLLLESLSPLSRVVVITSSLHEKGEINLSDLNSLQVIKKSNLYANSKLANIYFAQELARRIKLKNVKVYACCPGWVYTGLFRHSIRWYHYILIAPIALLFMRSPKQGAQTPLYCATEPSLENETGLLYRNCQHYNSKVIFYDNISFKLWNETENMINQIAEKN